ncbi:MAG: hypothetical protein PVJ66_01710 [Gammaproteobacteria bacterium]|jgi:hypothetical protein
MVAIVTLLVIAIGLGVVMLAMRSRRTRSRPRRGSQLRKQTPTPAAPAKPGGIEKLKCNALFWGVQMDHPGCEAARAIMDKQYPFDEAPEMPLEGCDSPTCTCLFKGLLDRRKLSRRSGSDRRNEIRFGDKGTDRRSRKDRRRGNAWSNRDY